jgi:hypothetical protein
MVPHDGTTATACREFEQDLVLFYYNDLTGADRVDIEKHIQECNQCGLYVRELGAILPLAAARDKPEASFWENYRREMRHKLEQADEQKSWRQALAAVVQPWRLPALATTGAIVLALTLTFGYAVWRDRQAPPDEQALVEVLPMAENLEFFRAMEVLDAMEFLEYLGSRPSGST